MSDQMLRAALAYAHEFNWPVGPLHEFRNGRCTCGKGARCSTPAKHPRWLAGVFEHGLRDFTTDPELITRLWRRFPNANIGRRPGAHDVVLDIDPRAGGDETLRDLEREHGPLPPTITTLTGGGGTHYAFDAGEQLQGKVIAPGVEFKGPDQLLVLPPSMHKSGSRYAWEASGHPRDVQAAPLPEWVKALARQPEGKKNPPGWAAQWLRTPIGPGDGRRNPAGLPKIVGYLRGHGIDCETAVAIVRLWDLQNQESLGEEELRRHVEGMYARYGMPGFTFVDRGNRRVIRMEPNEVHHAG